MGIFKSIKPLGRCHYKKDPHSNVGVNMLIVLYREYYCWIDTAEEGDVPAAAVVGATSITFVPV
jgi:hypothetical protein